MASIWAVQPRAWASSPRRLVLGGRSSTVVGWQFLGRRSISSASPRDGGRRVQHIRLRCWWEGLDQTAERDAGDLHQAHEPIRGAVHPQSLGRELEERWARTHTPQDDAENARACSTPSMAVSNVWEKLGHTKTWRE
jgi:hypothetical protein